MWFWIVSLCKSTLTSRLQSQSYLLRKIPKFHENFVGRYSFRRVLDELPETIRKLCLSTKFPHQEIWRNDGILRSENERYFKTSKLTNFIFSKKSLSGFSGHKGPKWSFASFKIFLGFDSWNCYDFFNTVRTTF